MQHSRDPAAWAITPADKAKYEQLYNRVRDPQGFIPGPQFSVLTPLAVGDAGHIFKLADFDRDLKLNKREFVVAMFLTDRKKEGYQISNALPPSLIDSANALIELPQTTSSPAPFNPSYNPNVPPTNAIYPNLQTVPSYNPNISSYNPNVATNPSYNLNISPTNPIYNPNVPPTNPSYNPQAGAPPPLSRTVSQPLPQISPDTDVARMIAEKDIIIANLQAQVAQLNDARLHAEDARKHSEELLLRSNLRLSQLEAHGPGSPSRTPIPTQSSSPTASIPPASTGSHGMLDALEATINASTSAQDIDALCVRLKSVHVRAKQRRVELQHFDQQRKIDELEHSLTCPICMDQKKNVSCVPCGHALCRACADAVLSTRGNHKCPICREEVRQTNAIYL